MRMVDGRVAHYRSIGDSGTVSFDPEVTCIVGAAGSGKTSFLRMLSGVSDDVRFDGSDLPRNSAILAKFRAGAVRAGEITQLTATFRVEDADRPRLPPEHRTAGLITVRRTLAGRIEVSVDGRVLPKADIRHASDDVLRRVDRVAETLCSQDGGGPEGGPMPVSAIDEAVSGFRESDFYDRDGMALAVRTLRMAVHLARLERKARIRIESELDGIEKLCLDIARTIRDDPTSTVYRAVPKPRYCGGVFELEDWIELDRFIADSFASKTFSCVALACGLTPAGLSKVRNAVPARRNGYLSAMSSLLNSRLGRFWGRESRALRLAIESGRLLLRVEDGTTGASTAPTEQSDGLRWRLAFFLDIMASLARKSGRHVILLDNPATELHEKGKSDVLRFIREAARLDRIQIIYSTHERALVDPWRIDRIRVADLTPEGTKIKTVQAASANGMLETVMNSIGSPARYSLFGAPRTVSFEGASDVYITSAVNEYMIAARPGASLDKNVYSITSMDGITKARYALSMYKNLGLDFAIVVDRGRESREVVGKVGIAEFERRFVEIPAVAGKDEADIEDLVDRSLYYEAFKAAYKGILDRMPPIDEIDADGGRRADNYRRWLKDSGREYGKALVAQHMFGVMINGGDAARNDPDRTRAVEGTCDAFASLFAAVKAKYEDA